MAGSGQHMLRSVFLSKDELHSMACDANLLRNQKLPGIELGWKGREYTVHTFCAVPLPLGALQTQAYAWVMYCIHFMLVSYSLHAGFVQLLPHVGPHIFYRLVTSLPSQYKSMRYSLVSHPLLSSVSNTSVARRRCCLPFLPCCHRVHKRLCILLCFGPPWQGRRQRGKRERRSMHRGS